VRVKGAGARRRGATPTAAAADLCDGACGRVAAAATEEQQQREVEATGALAGGHPRGRIEREKTFVFFSKDSETSTTPSKSESSMEESSRRAAAAAASGFLLPPRLSLDDDEPWWVLPLASGGGDGGFVVLGGAPAEATPLAAMLQRIASSSNDSPSGSSSVAAPLSHADAALAIRLLETEPKASVAAFQSLLERGGGEAALTRVARASPFLLAAAAATAAATSAAATAEEPLPPDLSLFEASTLASACLEAFLNAPVMLQWAEAASKLASKGAEAAAAPFLRTAASSSSSSSRPPPLTETNLLPPASFTRAAVSRALQAAQTHQHQLEMQQQLQQQQRHQSPSVPAALAAAETEPSAAASEAAALASIRLAVALIRSLLRSPRARRALSDPASRMELEAFCLAGARSRDATELYRDLKSGAVFR